MLKISHKQSTRKSCIKALILLKRFVCLTTTACNEAQLPDGVVNVANLWNILL